MSDLLEFFLACMWSLQPHGVDRVLRELQAHGIPNADYQYDEESGWFRVTCPEDKMKQIQSNYRDCLDGIERDVEVQDIVQEDGTLVETLDENNLYIKALKPNFLPHMEDAGHDEHRLPDDFGQFQAATSWTRLEKERKNVTIGALFSAEELDMFQKESGVTLATDLSQKLIFIGGDTQGKVGSAVAKLNVLFDQLKRPSLPPKHFIYAESSSDYRIDARYAAHINPKLIECTVFDPSTPDLGKLYQILCRTGACLRVCEAIPFSTGRRSLFGPRAAAVFSQKETRRQNQWFRKHTYASKSAIAPNTHLGTGQQVGIESWVEGVMDAAPSTSSSQPPGTPSTADNVGRTGQGYDGDPIASMLRRQSAQDAQAWLDQVRMASNAPSSAAGVRAVSMSGQHTAAATPGLESQASSKLRGTAAEQRDRAQLSSATGQISAITHDMADLMTFDTSELLSGVPASLAARREYASALPSGALQGPSGDKGDPARQFVDKLRLGFRELVEQYRTKRGRIEIRVDLGRILLTNFVPSGLAWNRQDEISNGWTETELITRLDGGCVSAKDIAFTSILSSFGNDADFIAHLKDGSGKPMWEVVETRVVYKFWCQCHIGNLDGTHLGIETFVIEIDGTVPRHFTYSLRRASSRSAPLWVHCIHRSWDVQGLLTYTPTLRLENDHGPFAKSLLDSLSIRPNVKRRPAFEINPDSRTIRDRERKLQYRTTVADARVRHVAMFRSSDGQSCLELVQIEDMRLIEASPKSPGELTKLQALPKDDDLDEGKLSIRHKASISSVRAQAILAENEKLPIGGEPTWTADTMEEQGVWEALYGPALSMIKQMDGVGVLVDNGQKKKHTKETSAVGLHAKREAEQEEADQGEYW